jgi:transcriptional regulator with XRE-family HTH domain
MDDLTVGLVLRAVRRRRRWRQKDVAEQAGVSQKLVSLAETGHLERLSVRSLRTIAQVLEIRILIDARWRGGQLPRVLDEEPCW